MDLTAILGLAGDKDTRKYFKKYQVAALCNIGTSFGMGLIVITFMLGVGSGFGTAVLSGLIGAIVGSIISTRLMLFSTERYYKKTGQWEEMNEYDDDDLNNAEDSSTESSDEVMVTDNVFNRTLEAILEGGKLGWQVAISVTPGVVFITTFIMILTFEPSEYNSSGDAVFTGRQYEGVALLPLIGNFIEPVTNILFGFTDGSNISVPITALATAGAAIALVPSMVESGLAGANEIAVFTAMSMCFSGYLTTHVAMMEVLGRRELVSKALIAHTIGGIFAGIVAHYIFMPF